MPSDPETATKPGAKSKQPPTEYVVLQSTDGITWMTVGKIEDGAIVGTFKASSTNAAIKQWVGSTDAAADVMFVAVPARSWQPVQQKTTTKTVTTLEAL